MAASSILQLPIYNLLHPHRDTHVGFPLHCAAHQLGECLIWRLVMLQDVAALFGPAGKIRVNLLQNACYNVLRNRKKGNLLEPSQVFG